MHFSLLERLEFAGTLFSIDMQSKYFQTQRCSKDPMQTSKMEIFEAIVKG